MAQHIIYRFKSSFKYVSAWNEKPTARHERGLGT